LPANVRDPQTVKQFLKRLRSANASLPCCGSSIGLMFACVSRGHEFYEESGVESKAFSELYPGVPLLGFFGDGEIGFDSSETTVICNDSSSSSSGPQLFHFKTSVFVMISFS
jgi:F-box protein 22